MPASWALALLLGTAFLSDAAQSAKPPPFEVEISSAAVYPGEVLRVLVGLPDPKRAALSFRSREYPLYRAGDKLRGLIGFTAKAAPGQAELKVIKKRWLLPNQVQFFAIRVLPRKFSEQALKLPKKKVQLTQKPEAKAALGAIRPSLRSETPLQRWHGTFLLPVKARLSSTYGRPRRINKTKPWDWHKGIDLAARLGTLAAAPNDGVVVLTGRYPLQGGTVVLDHGQGVSSMFLHLAQILVSPGQQVRKGESIATVGAAGFSTGSHLHWGIYVHGDPVDPMPWLEREF